MLKDHDEFCNQAVGIWDGGCQCEKIAKIRADERKYVISVIEELPCQCGEDKDYCDGQTDAINAIEAICFNESSNGAEETVEIRGEEHVDWCRDLYCYGCREVR